MVEVEVVTPDAVLPGRLILPASARGLVLFAHGSGSSRFSARNRFVAEALNERALATLLFDLLTPEEYEVDVVTAEWRFDIGLLSRRLGGAVDWARSELALRALPVGLFGASTGAAAALNVAGDKPTAVAAVVSRGGRPDLADALPRVQAPTLLIVGGLDEAVIRLNESAFRAIECAARAGHRTRRNPFVRGIRRARKGGAARRRMVHPPPPSLSRARSSAGICAGGDTPSRRRRGTCAWYRAVRP